MLACLVHLVTPPPLEVDSGEKSGSGRSLLRAVPAAADLLYLMRSVPVLLFDGPNYNLAILR